MPNTALGPLRVPESPSRQLVLAAVSVLVLTVLLLDVPYRLLYQGNRFEKVRLDREACYVIGDRADSLLLHCPNAPVPRNRRIRRDDPRLQRLGCDGSVFDRSTACEPLK